MSAAIKPCRFPATLVDPGHTRKGIGEPCRIRIFYESCFGGDMGLANVTRAFFKRLLPPLATVLVVALAAAVLMLFDYVDRRAPKNWQLDNTWKKTLCRMPEVCTNYGATRLECATAGNFNNCIHVKMGRDAWAIDECSDEGELAVPSRDTPGPLECLLRKSDFVAKIIEINAQR